MYGITGRGEKLSAVEKYVLMLLYAAGGKARGKLWLHKEVFALSKAFSDLADELDFEAYSYGSFSEALDQYGDVLERSGLIEDLRLTDRGLELAKRLWELESDDKKEVVKGIAEFFEKLDRDELLLYTYVNYPEASEESDVRERVVRKRKEIALKMLREGKVSVSLAAQLAGLPVEEFIEMAVKRGVKPFEVQGDLNEASR